MTEAQNIAAPAHDRGEIPQLAWLPIAELHVDHTYQRTLESRRSQKLVAKIAEHFRWPAFGAVLVTRDTNAPGWLIIDGQHRTEGARVAGITEVPCVIVAIEDVAAQAQAFVRANNDRVTVNQFSLHHARVAAEDEDAVNIDLACYRAGVSIARHPIPADKLKPHQTLALGTIAAIVKKHSVSLAAGALRAVALGWKGKPGTLRATIIKAVAEMAVKRTPAERPAFFKDVELFLSLTPPSALFSDAGLLRFSRNIPEHVAIVVLITDWLARRGGKRAA